MRAVEHVLTGHSKSVLCLRVYQGRTLFTGSADGLLKVQTPLPPPPPSPRAPCFVRLVDCSCIKQVPRSWHFFRK